MYHFRSFLSVAALTIFCWITIFPQSGQPFSVDEAPLANNGQPVNDYANVIDDATEQQLNQKLKDFMARTNPPIVLAVATVRTTGDRPAFDYSLAIARGWKIGSKTDDNPSALLFVAVDDRKYQTQISRDLEDELPDGIAGQLQRQHLVPAFRQGDYSKGINDTIDAYIKTIEARASGTVSETVPQTEPTPARNGSRRTNSAFSTGACCLIVLILLMIIIFSRGGRGGRGGWGGGGGGFGGGALPWIIGSIIANSGNNSSSWGGGGGSSWGGGSSGGGDWGGFGGGGDFGGGGAGGDW